MTTQSTALLDARQPTHSLLGNAPLQAFGLRSPALKPAGSWQLAAGHAVTLHDDRAAVLRITHGSVWATVDGPHAGPANNQGDVFLSAGERLTLQAGQRVVIEPCSDSNSANEAVYFSWDPALATVDVPPQPYAVAGSRMQVAVVRPLRDFALALKMAAQALGRLVWGIAGLSEFLIAGRGRVQPCMESNAP
jgi:Protein of unknown function (DUF2917)